MVGGRIEICACTSAELATASPTTHNATTNRSSVRVTIALPVQVSRNTRSTTILYDNATTFQFHIEFRFTKKRTFCPK